MVNKKSLVTCVCVFQNQPEVLPGDCWCFEGTRGFVTVNVSGPDHHCITVSAVDSCSSAVYLCRGDICNPGAYSSVPVSSWEDQQCSQTVPSAGEPLCLTPYTLTSPFAILRARHLGWIKSNPLGPSLTPRSPHLFRHLTFLYVTLPWC